MAAVQITIKDADANNIAVDIHLAPQFPDSQLLYTNAQLVAKDVLAFIQQIANGINNKQFRDALNESIKLNS